MVTSSDLKRSVTPKTNMNPTYLPLEKNGRSVAGKFDSKELKFKTPNTVVVFSNEKPDVSELSKDRWKIFRIRDDDLIDVTGIYTGIL